MDSGNADLCAKDCRLSWTVGNRQTVCDAEKETSVLVAMEADQLVTLGAWGIQSRCIVLAASKVSGKAKDQKGSRIKL